MLAELLFPEIKETPNDIIKKYPKRHSNQIVTRMAPSPTWFLHIGAIYSALLDLIVARKNSWICMLRLEDTDQKREIEWAKQKFVDTFKKFWINFDEGPIWLNCSDVWAYWPYIQSKREYIYKVFIKDLVAKWIAYPCFMSEEEIDDIRAIQEASKIPTWIYKEFSKYRNSSYDEIKKLINDWKQFIIRFKSNWEITKKVEVNDLIKWKITIWENFSDIVIMKKDWLPTYHFAHLVDDFLMWTTTVIRSDEWFASLPLHNQLFETMWRKAPDYAHYGPLVKIDWDSRRKLSKRKDPEADVDFYFREWYLIEAMQDFLSNMINAWFEDWRKQNLEKSFLEFDFKLEKLSTSWALIDLDKLNFVNSKLIASMDIDILYEKLEIYLKEYFSDFYQNNFLKNSQSYNKKILSELKTRLTRFSEFEKLTTFFYNDFEVTNKTLDLLVNPKMKIETLEIAKKWLEIAISVLKNNDLKTPDDIKNIFVEEIKKAEMKNWQVLWPVRVALSWEEFSPGALELIFILWIEKSSQRIENILKNI